MVTLEPLAVGIISSIALAICCPLKEIKDQILECRDQHAVSRLDPFIRTGGLKTDTLN